jgi:DNA-binding response OmpR family regulator
MARILVIDDDTALREMLYDTLTRKGHEITTASTGEQAMEVMKTVRPDAILLDGRMPGWSGVQTAEHIREFDDAVPIVIMRGAGEADMRVEDLKRLGIAEVLRKELGVELFLSAVELTLKRLSRAPSAGGANGAQAMGIAGTLLITDDDSQVRRLLQAFFEHRGLRVVTAGSGQEALKALTTKPNAVILDMTCRGWMGS